MSFSAAFSVKSAGFATRGAGAAGAGSGAAGAGSGAAATGAGGAGAGAGAGACSCAGAAGAGTLACVTAGCFAQPPARIRTATEVTATVVATDPRFIVIPPLSLDDRALVDSDHLAPPVLAARHRNVASHHRRRRTLPVSHGEQEVLPRGEVRGVLPPGRPFLARRAASRHQHDNPQHHSSSRFRLHCSTPVWTE